MIDSIRAMFGDADLTEDMDTKTFKQAIGDDFIPHWVVGFFRYVKYAYDSNIASFMFVTSKPMHLVLEISMIKRSMIGNVIKRDLDNIKKYSYLALNLTDEDIKKYLAQRIPSSMVDSFFSALQDKERKGEAERRRIGHLVEMVNDLLKEKEWQDKLHGV